MPADLLLAVAHATTVLAWQENLTEEEMPPAWMWPLNDELDEWFKRVAARRAEKYGGPEVLEDAPDMMQNELTRGRFGR